VVFSVLVGSGVQGRWNPHSLHDHPVTEYMFWAGVILGGVGLVLVAWALLPRTKHLGDRSQLAYFGHVTLYREKGLAIRKETRRANVKMSKQKLAEAIRVASLGSFERTVDQVWVVSHIAHRKYLRIRYCLLSYGVAAALCVSAPIVNHWLR
jgi:hypothetical protein